MKSDVDYSKEVEAASDAVFDAKCRLGDVMRRVYPKGASVRVVHPRGEFLGTVDYISVRNRNVLVRNDNTGKTKEWLYRYVEVINP